MSKKAIPLKETSRLMERGVATLTECDEIAWVFQANVASIRMQFFDVVNAERASLAALLTTMTIPLEDEFAQLAPLPGLLSSSALPIGAVLPPRNKSGGIAPRASMGAETRPLGPGPSELTPTDLADVQRSAAIFTEHVQRGTALGSDRALANPTGLFDRLPAPSKNGVRTPLRAIDLPWPRWWDKEGLAAKSAVAFFDHESSIDASAPLVNMG